MNTVIDARRAFAKVRLTVYIKRKRQAMHTFTAEEDAEDLLDIKRCRRIAECKTKFICVGCGAHCCEHRCMLHNNEEGTAVCGRCKLRGVRNDGAQVGPHTTGMQGVASTAANKWFRS